MGTKWSNSLYGFFIKENIKKILKILKILKMHKM